MKKLYFAGWFLVLSSAIFALPGDLDTNFGVSGGYVVSDFESAQRDERHRDSVIQADGKIIVVGKRFQGTIGFDEYLVARYNADGTLDTTFSGDGFFTLFDNSQFESANAVAIQPDGKIIVVGGEGSSSTEAFIFRLNSDGTLDTTFSGDGIQVITNSGTALSVVIQPSDSKIVIGTSSIGNNLPTINQTVVLRLNTDGSLDTTFDGDGRVFVNPSIFFPNGLALQTDGKIVVAGQNSANSTFHDVSLIRLNPNGTFDTSFDGDGVVQTVLANQESEARCVVIQSDGKIIIGGSSTQPTTTSRSDPTLIRYNSDGSLDTSFDSDGVKIVELLNNNEDNHFYDIIQQTDGKIIGISNTDGNFSFFIRDDFFVTRFNSNGSLDSSFDTNGIAKSQWCEDGTELVLQPDGKIVAVGSQYRPNISTQNHGICVQRFNQNGSVDYGFNAVAPNGKTSFSNYGFTEVSAVAGLPNGKILVAGWGESATITEALLIRLNADGTLDTSFMNEGIYLKNTITSAQPYYFYDLKTLSDGSFFIAGGSNELGGVIIKFTAAGVPDTTFSGDGVVTSLSATRFYALTTQSDGKIVGCGSLGTGTRSGRIVRFSATGIQEAFASNNMGASGNNNEILECGLQTDGKIVVAGYGFDGISDSVRTSRHLTTLTIDTTFGTSGVTTTDMSATLNDRATDMVVQSDDKIVVSSMGFNSDRDFAVIRYDANGALDPNFYENFGTGGISLIDFVVGNPNDEANALLIQPDGQLIVGGASNPGTGERFSLAKLNADGSLALGFGTLGRASTLFPNNDARINALGFYLNDRILTAGRTWNGTDYDFALVRYQNEFIPTAANVSVSGMVLLANGGGIRNVIVTLADTNGNILTVRTNAFGHFRFDEIDVGQTYIISVVAKRFTFSQSSQVLVVTDELKDIIFIAEE